MRPSNLMATVVFVAACSAAPDVPGKHSEQAVMEPIHRLFRAMERSDSSLARSAFHDDARLVRLPDGIQEFRVDTATVDRFVAEIGGERDESWAEPIWDWEVRVDGNLAAVWTKYSFYRDGQFSHCGVDAFQLVESSKGWKVVSLMYSRRQNGCEEPPGR